MIKPLSEKDWIRSFEFAPRVACNLIVLDNNKLLLTKRAIPPFKNFWHVPGSFIRKGEGIEECLSRIGREELGLKIDIKKVKFINLFEDLDKDPRGHIIDLFYAYQSKQVALISNTENKELKFFEKLPSDIGFNHKESLAKMGFK